MVQKLYAWSDGAELDAHTKRKHKILREYLYEYIKVRCVTPQQEKFRLAIVDGFAGGGRYKCGAPGSPIIFIEELRAALKEINIRRASDGMKTIQIECILILNDHHPEAFEQLKLNVAPIHAEAKENEPNLKLQPYFFNEAFENAYPQIKALINAGGYNNVLFNLDQCGHTHVLRETLDDIMQSFVAPEIFYTFAINSLLTFLQASEPEKLKRQLRYVGLETTDWEKLEPHTSKKQWLAIAEKVVFDAFCRCARYVSPFSINNPDGWRYWMIHFSNRTKARQVYNNILHDNSTSQAHFGRAGLDMLSYDPDHEGALYLFGNDNRMEARAQLLDDIPRMISRTGDAISMQDFYESIYNQTPSHMDDIHGAMIESPDLEVLTPSGGERRKPNTISAGDILRLKSQLSFFPMFPKPKG